MRAASTMSVAALATILTSCSLFGEKPPAAPEAAPSICDVYRYHRDSERTKEFFRVNAPKFPEVRADLDARADNQKSYRCICTADKTGCPDGPPK